MSKLTLDEAIKHCLEVAEENEELSSKFDEWDEWEEADANNCRECAADHRQLAEWLTELKEAKRLLKAAIGIIKDVDCNEDYLCDECEYRAKCDGGFSFYWRYADEALKLLGSDTNE
jgi:hypothetical protein